jgi:hypothetical protein
VGLEAQHLAMVCTCENLSDWSGQTGRAVGGSTARSVFLALQTELREAWLSLRGQIARDEHVGAPVISAIFDLLQVYLDRRYARYALVLPPGRLREEVLANVARQSEELRLYFAAFNQSLADRCLRQVYEDQARFAGDRYLALLSPAMAVLLDGDNALGAATPRSSAGSGSAATVSAGARRNISKTVSFEATPPATPSAPAAAAAAQPAAAALSPPPAAHGWPPYMLPPNALLPGGRPVHLQRAGGPLLAPAAWCCSVGRFCWRSPGVGLSLRGSGPRPAGLVAVAARQARPRRRKHGWGALLGPAAAPVRGRS